MDFWLTVRAIGRRWYLSIPVFLLVIAVALFAADRTTHEYQSTGTVVLSEPDPSAAHVDHSVDKGVANPLLAFADSLTTSAQLLIQNLNSPAAQQAIAAQGGTATITASNGMLTGPFIVITADNPDPAAVQQTVALAFGYVNKELLQREQALGAPKVQYIAVKTVVAPTTAAPLLGGKSRFLGSTFVLALAASLCVTYGVETISRRRRQRLRTAS